jgi:predicted Zn finger-like uncharacterized protein
MNATCTHCGTVFRVDPAKVPAGGVRARCSICRKVFTVAREERGDDAPPVAVPQGEEPAAAESAAARAPDPASDPTPEPARAPQPEPEPDPEAAPERALEPSPEPVSSTPSPPAPPASSPFGSSDPNAKARRLARALVSDMVTYHPDRRDSALAAGTLRQEFREEIKKSWEEYVEQVGRERAMQTPHFRNALNEILARGQSVF